MKHSTSDKLVFCHEALHLRRKRQSAGWEPEIEKWDTNTESEGSADEEHVTEDFKAIELSEEQLLRLTC